MNPPQRSILLITDETVTSPLIAVLRRGIEEFLMAAGIKLPVFHLSEPETLDLLPPGPAPQNTAYFVGAALAPSGTSLKDKLSASVLLNLFTSSIWAKLRDPYFIFVTNRKIYAEGYNELLGWYLEGVGTVVSTTLITATAEPLRSECIISLVMHQLGHAVGLIPEGRTEAVQKSYGLHCANVCTMQHLSNAETHVKNRLAKGAFCPACTKDLRTIFA